MPLSPFSPSFFSLVQLSSQGALTSGTSYAQQHRLNLLANHRAQKIIPKRICWS